MIPSDLDLPSKFTAFRRGQDDVSIAIASSDKRFALLDCPTGGGKSLIYLAVAKLLNARTLVLTGTKGLQHQLMNDFAACGMVDIRGQSNYKCIALDNEFKELGQPGGCDVGPCHVGVWCPLSLSGCHYYDAQRVAAESKIVVTNYAFWLTLGRHSDPNAIGKFDLLVLDEAHAASDYLADFCAVELDRREVKQLLGLDLPPLNEGIAVWSDWAKVAFSLVQIKYAEMKAELLVVGSDKRHITKQLFRLSSLRRDLEEMSHAGQWKSSEGSQKEVKMPGMLTDWVSQETLKGAKFSPVWAHGYAEEYLFRGIKRVVLASATLSPQVGKYLGISAKDQDYHPVESSFDPKKRPFIYIPTTRVDRNMMRGQVILWMNKIDQIIGDRLDRKGIIHSRSYDRCRQIVEMSRYREHMMTHTSSRDLQSTVREFKRSKAPKILVSPSVETGFDFPLEECRYQIIAKIPFLDSRDLVTKARMKSDKDYGNYVAAMTLVQQVGRGVRSESDWAEAFILDDHFAWFRSRAQLPRWFKKSMIQASKVPSPPKL